MKNIINYLERENILGKGFNLSIEEIPPSMLLDYNKSILKFWLKLCKNHFTILIPKIENLDIQFDGKIVLNSDEYITKIKINSPSFNIYFKNFLGKLILQDKNPKLIYAYRRMKYVDVLEFLNFNNSIIRLLPFDFLSRLSSSKFGPMVCLNFYFTIFKMFFLSQRNDERILYDLLKKTYKKLKLVKSTELHGKWKSYYKGIALNKIISEEENKLNNLLDKRQKIIFNQLKNFKNGTVLDVASNQGLFSILAVKAGHSVVSIDNDISTIDKLYNLKNKFRLPIIPAIIDFNELNENKISRLKCDYVLALGFTHHLYLVNKVSWEKISNILYNLTKKSLITDFKLNTNAYGADQIINKSWKDKYNLKEFLRHLEKKFTSVDLISVKDSDRKIVLCTK